MFLNLAPVSSLSNCAANLEYPVLTSTAMLTEVPLERLNERSSEIVGMSPIVMGTIIKLMKYLYELSTNQAHTCKTFGIVTKPRVNC